MALFGMALIAFSAAAEMATVFPSQTVAGIRLEQLRTIFPAAEVDTRSVGERYTRAGSLQRSMDGLLVDQQGNPPSVAQGLQQIEAVMAQRCIVSIHHDRVEEGVDWLPQLGQAGQRLGVFIPRQMPPGHPRRSQPKHTTPRVPACVSWMVSVLRCRIQRRSLPANGWR